MLPCSRSASRPLCPCTHAPVHPCIHSSLQPLCLCIHAPSLPHNPSAPMCPCTHACRTGAWHCPWHLPLCSATVCIAHGQRQLQQQGTTILRLRTGQGCVWRGGKTGQRQLQEGGKAEGEQHEGVGKRTRYLQTRYLQTAPDFKATLRACTYGYCCHAGGVGQGVGHGGGRRGQTDYAFPHARRSVLSP